MPAHVQQVYTCHKALDQLTVQCRSRDSNLDLGVETFPLFVGFDFYQPLSKYDDGDGFEET